MRVMSRQADRARTAKRAVESGRAPYMTSGPSRLATAPVPMPRVRARPTGSRISAAASAPRRHASTATVEPAMTETTCAARNQLAVPATAIGRAARRDGRGIQTSKAARGTVSGWVW